MHFKGNIFLDENLPFALIEFFVERKINVEHIKKIGKTGIKNGDVYQYAEANKMWIVTRDADFQNYSKFQQYHISGIILFKTSLSNKPYLLKILKNFWNKYSEKLTKKLLIIISDNKVIFTE